MCQTFCRVTLAIAGLIANSFVVQAAESSGKPIAQWNFGTEEFSALKSHGGVHRDLAGPRPPHFPDFDEHNTAVLFDGDGSYFSIADPGADSKFDFQNGDSITIEAWVDLHSIGSGQNAYVVCKGRTGNKKFSADNQNWAMRIREQGGNAHISFLFATAPGTSNESPWHRWTSKDGFKLQSGWHRIAVSYTFGDPESVRGWIDDRPQTGSWDMGGKTSEPPIVDDDAVWIGSSLGGSAGNSFRGMIDSVAIYRESLSDEQMAARYRLEGQTPPSDLPKPTLPTFALTGNAVAMTIREGLATHNRWPLATEMPPPVSVQFADLHWTSPYFFLPRMPHRFDDWGVRDSWKPPALVHLAADVEFPAGTLRLLVRNRGLGRLWIDDAVVLETPPHQGSTDGHNPVDPLPEQPLPGHRVVAYGDTETIGEVSFKTGGTHRVVLETIIGGDKFRVESGETLVAFWTDNDDSIELLQAAGSTMLKRRLVDSDIDSVSREAKRSLTLFDDAVRRQIASKHDDYWNERHEYARDVVQPQSGSSIDKFVADRLATVVNQPEAKAASDDDGFQREVLPILREHCWRCHDEDAEGGLQLTSLELASIGGDSGEPAIVPNSPETSHLVERIFATDTDERMPPSGKMTAEQAKRLVDWIKAGAEWTNRIDPERLVVAPIIDDTAFLRRLSLDTVGVPPSERELREFLASDNVNKRSEAIDRLLSDERYADHWVSFWQDALAENPNVLKPSLNNTGPFRWYLHDALRDNWAVDRMVTELLMFRGSERLGGAAGFAMAADNDAPLASRSLVAASSLLGINLQCARCHDSPYHSTKQEDLFSLAAMLSRGNVTVPPTSTVSPGFFESKGGRESLIKVTLLPGEPVQPQWPFADTTGIADGELVERWLRDSADSRERLACLVTSPHNQRFAAVIVNHFWKRLIGAGIVEPAADWEAATPSDAKLLEWLSAQFIENGYDAKHLLRLVFNSDLYQREAVGRNRDAPPDERFFASPDRRRLTAEQVVDSLYYASGREIEVEQLTFDPEARRPASTMISLGYPSRAWEFSTLSNERDRPSLALPRAQAVTDVLEAFGWTGSRQSPIIDREQAPGVLQSGMLANGVMSSWITRASIDSELADLAVNAASAGELLDSVYLRFLSRYPTTAEKNVFLKEIDSGFADRLLPSEQIVWPEPQMPLGHVSWSNHLKPEANVIQVQNQERARAGDPPDPRLRPTWREAYEDVVWAVVNSPEFVFVP